ncbi:DISARM system phospholipase D-like protein DrmC [Azospirillum brasilense]|uniref:DISARM system phospholipase D-like protein DrmC n=1 Tax=Azospirillum brasilense TaxID=192 RepID=UPI000E689743|nr:DISARM system phospholipase D-like protein DrmC [Azospirillum brasilense]NUB23338.1 phospholipase [Azospirillum brasilense]NUB30960.1 phospholipase [Azospirillum brasilense]RIW05657.1 phospholipase [Azospirillum brasilense]
MEPILIAAGELVALLSPSRIEAVADRVRGLMPTEVDGGLYHLVSTPTARAALDRLLTTWAQTAISGDILAGILVGAAYARQQALRESSIELVWTGPTTSFVATRRTDQVLLDLIRHARIDVFLVSFVAYDVPTVTDALNAAAARNVELRILLETSTNHGGSLSVDPIATMRSRVPSAALYVWTDRPAPFTDGRVHAKVAVADGNTAFLTSANLTRHALEKNMEAGVVISGGHIPAGVRAHLQALIETKIIRQV